MIPNVALYAANFTDGEVVKTVIDDTLTVRASIKTPMHACMLVVATTYYYVGSFGTIRLMGVTWKCVQVNTNPFTITPTGGGKATVTFTDFIACKAIEHVLDTVLLPKSVCLPIPLKRFKEPWKNV